MPITIPDDKSQTDFSGTSSIDTMLEKMQTKELDRYIQTLRIHMESNFDKNDIVVDRLLQLAEYEQLRRD